MPDHIPFRDIHTFLSTHVYPPNINEKGSKANFRRSCKRFTIQNGELHYKKGKKGVERNVSFLSKL